MIGLEYKDTIKLYKQSFNGYGDESSHELAEVKSLFLQQTGTSHSQNIDLINAQAHAYVDPSNAFIKSNHNRLEGMLVYSNPFGDNDDDSWYKIIGVVVGQDKLLTNQIDNIHIYMKKTAGPSNVS